MCARRRASLRRLWCRSAALSLLALTGLPMAASAQHAAPEGSSGRVGKEIVRAERYLVVSANPLASEAGAAILAEGGTAVDAAVTTQLMLNLVEPQSSGIGGGAFLLYWDAGTRTLTTFDGRETAPALAGPDYFLKADGTAMDSMPRCRAAARSACRGPCGFWSWRTGCTAGAAGAADRAGGSQGRSGLRDLAAARQPRRGRCRGAAALCGDGGYFLARRPAQGGRPTLRNPEFAATLRQVAQEGADAFYKGEIARDIVETVRRARSIRAS